MAEWVAETKGLAAGSIAFSYRWSKNDYPAVKDFGLNTDSPTIILKLIIILAFNFKFYKISKI